MSLLSQSLLEIKAHAHALNEKELQMLKKTHQHPPTMATTTHLIDSKRQIPPADSVLPTVVRLDIKPPPEKPKKSKEAVKDELTYRIRTELKLADKIIDILFDMMSPEQKVLAGKRLIQNRLAGETVIRSDERKKASQLYR